MPELTRRAAIAMGISGVALFSIAGISAAASAPLGRRTDAVLRSHFTPFLGGEFTASGASGSHQLRLVQILDVAQSAAVGSEHEFNLIFEQGGAARVREGIYSISRDTAPTSTLFISPVGMGPGPQQLQALINSPA